MTRVVTFADGFSSVSPPQTVVAVEQYNILNNTTLGSILTLNSTFYKSVFFDYELRRSSSLGTFLQAGSAIASYNGSWSLSFGNFQGDDIIKSIPSLPEEVNIQLNSVTGELKYDSLNMTGTGYTGTLKLSIVRAI
jgi:hypothetical protein